MNDTSALGFDSAFLQRLQRLSVVNREPVRGPFAGPRRSRQYGNSVEFADFRDYAPGDDLRRVDWNAYARLDRLFLRLYHAERMTTLTLILDHSPSMGFGAPSKVLVAGRLAAIFAYIALANFDRVAVLGLGDRLDYHYEGRGGKSSIPEVWRHITAIMTAAGGPTDFGSLRSYRAVRRGPGMTIMLSDFFTESDWRAGLRSLRAAGQEIAAVQVLTPEELEPSIRGDWALHDAEGPQVIETSVTGRVLRRYQEELESHSAGLRDGCRRLNVALSRVRTDASLLTDALRDLHAAGVLR